MDLKIFDFTNKELLVLAEEYIKHKIKREFLIANSTTNRKYAQDAIEIDIDVVDLKERRYSFKFYFTLSSFDCYCSSMSSRAPIKFTSNESVETMEMFLHHFALKGGEDYISFFHDKMTKIFDFQYITEKSNAKSMNDVEIAKKDLNNKLQELKTVCDTVITKIGTENI